MFGAYVRLGAREQMTVCADSQILGVGINLIAGYIVYIQKGAEGGIGSSDEVLLLVHMPIPILIIIFVKVEDSARE